MSSVDCSNFKAVVVVGNGASFSALKARPYSVRPRNVLDLD